MCSIAGNNVTEHEFLARLTYPSINVQNESLFEFQTFGKFLKTFFHNKNY